MKKITVRIPDDLHRELRSIADDQDRSLNNQILYLLRQAAKELQHGKQPSTDERVAAHHRDR